MPDEMLSSVGMNQTVVWGSVQARYQVSIFTRQISNMLLFLCKHRKTKEVLKMSAKITVLSVHKGFISCMHSIQLIYECQTATDCCLLTPLNLLSAATKSMKHSSSHVTIQLHINIRLNRRNSATGTCKSYLHTPNATPTPSKFQNLYSVMKSLTTFPLLVLWHLTNDVSHESWDCDELLY